MIQELISKYSLPRDLHVIKSLSKREWTQRVKTEIEKRNKKRLIKDCYKEKDGQTMRKPKTASIVDHIEKPDYQRDSRQELLKCTKLETKTIIIARYGMLECGTNFMGTKDVILKDCQVRDDEDHRLNHCLTYQSINNKHTGVLTNFNDVYSSDIYTLRAIIPQILKVWNLRNANGTMNI